MTQLLPAYGYQDDIRELFSEYTNMLTENDPAFSKYLALQNYDSELRHLEDKYGLPDGRLYIIRVDDKAAGCIGLKKIDSLNCEMKRLYIRPQYRGRKLSHLLIERIIRDAREAGYRYMLLDTLPFLKSAVQLYKQYGFYEIPGYNNSPMDTSIYMKLDL